MDYFSDSMNRVHRLFAVAKGFAAKGVEKDDEPVWVAGDIRNAARAYRE